MSDSKTNNTNNTATSARTLFIGLGGTGGKVLIKLHDKLTEEQKKYSHMLYLDLDKKDTDILENKGVATVRISSSDTVCDVKNFLGDDDGVNEWLPNDFDTDNEFLLSNTDSGASQYRIKSRLCLAKYFYKGTNELTRLLDSICSPGTPLSADTLRVMIVSSVAGGTGAGTFIQMALFIRKYLRDKGHNDIHITGVFGLPDLYTKRITVDQGSKTNIENMYSNAYAAVRELNAMNLAVAHGAKADGYGKSINIKIKTESEGLLFDSSDPTFIKGNNGDKRNVKKPFNSIYFIDESSEKGGVLPTLDQYYGVMADIVHTRLYSPLEGTLKGIEDNELNIHNNFPTAIYGSSGYGKIIYPYDGIIDYLATRKTSDELNYVWDLPESAWERYKTERKKEAKLSGTRWSPTTQERALRFKSDLNDYMSSKPKFAFLKAQIKETGAAKNRAELFIDSIEKLTYSASGIEDKPDVADAPFGLAKNPEIARIRSEIASGYKSKPNAEGIPADNAIDSITQANGVASLHVDAYITELTKNTAGRAATIASQIIPVNKQDNLSAINDKDERLNLFYGLLAIDEKAVHPLAARYLLYELRDIIDQKIAKYKYSKDNLYKFKSHFDLGLDDDKYDDNKLTVEIQIKKIKTKRFLSFDKDIYDPETAVNDYYQNYAETLGALMKAATENFRYEIYERVKTSLNYLIELYESLFDNLKIFKTAIGTRLATEEIRHEQSSDVRCRFINASLDEKEYLYFGDRRTLEVLDECADEIASAAGLGIYEKLLEITWKKIEDEENNIITDGYVSNKNTDDFSKLSTIFDNVIDIYSNVLKNKATHLRANVITALIRQACFTLGVTEDDLSDFAIQNNVKDAVIKVVTDMADKALPMLNYDSQNVDMYFKEETTNPDVANTKNYMHFGINSDICKDLMRLFVSNDEKSATELFRNSIQDLNELVTDKRFSEYELICFRAVHCLQPTQIYKFRESNFNGFYTYYKKRLKLINSTNAYSNTPHLDKRWHLREAMPYISRVSELEWRKKTIKAFICAVLTKNITATNYGNTKCFDFLDPNEDVASLIFWPEKKLVTQKDVSKVIEFLTEKTELVEFFCEQFDREFNGILLKLSNYNDEISKYKYAVTTDKKLRKLYGKLIEEEDTISPSTSGHGENAVINDLNSKYSEEEIATMNKAASSLYGDNESEIDFSIISNSLGGLLEFAWNVHKSEEALSRDYDYGEAIIQFGLELVEKIVRNMCGENIAEFDEGYTEYVDLYNHILERFLKYFIDAKLINRKLMDNKFIAKMDGDVFYKYVKIPEFITKEKDFKWIVKNWKKKELKTY